MCDDAQCTCPETTQLRGLDLTSCLPQATELKDHKLPLTDKQSIEDINNVSMCVRGAGVLTKSTHKTD